jgi:octaprenyl-diphosphate synthase
MTPALNILKPLLETPESEGLRSFMGRFEDGLNGFAREQKGFLSQLMDYVLSGSGKRVRPALVYVCSRWGNARPEDVERAALAVEFIHIATLIHDDLVDEAVLRRQKPTVTVKFGEGAAVLLGDYVYAQSFAQLGALGDAELIRLFSETTLSMCDGEIGQIERRYDFDLTEEDYLSFLDKKTASLMAAACRAGGRLAGLTAAHQATLETFGRKIGLAFQIVDDILDLEGEEAVTGKTLRTDLKHGKMTLPLIHYRAQLPTAGARTALQAELRSLNGNMPDLIRRVAEAGSMTYARQKVQDLLRDAEKSIASLPENPSRALLLSIAQRLSDRNV